MIVIARIHVLPGQEQNFENIMLDLAQMVRRDEPGVIFYHMCTGDATGTYTFVERYVSKAAFDNHIQTPYFLSASAKLAGMLAGAPEMEVLTELG